MTAKIFIVTFCLISFQTIAQSNVKTVYQFCDRDKPYEAAESIERSYTNDGKLKEICSFNGRIVTKFMYDQNRIADSAIYYASLPYRLVKFDLDSIKISEYLTLRGCYYGFYYTFYSNGKLKTSGQYHVLTDQELAELHQKKGDCNAVQDGKWIYYDISGNEMRAEEFVRGKLKK
ncbi:MAG TPA: hypothetical protein VE978_10620 [Chitinophagales bacterium]|nr:hypothetical protein [Chitinophagales bacterium]